MIIRFSLISSLCLYSFLTFSQDRIHNDTTSTTRRIGFSIISGTLVPHDKALKPLKEGIIKAFELRYSVFKVDNEIWRGYYNYPDVGVSYMFMDLGYKKVLGYSHSIYPYIEFPFTKRDKSINIGIRVAIGLSYITKLYDSIANPSNIAISTPINLYASMGLNLSHNLTRNISANAGINASHFSNGSIKKPNYGLNILTGNLGIVYNFNHRLGQSKKYTDFEINKARWLAILSGGIKETIDPGGSKYGIGSLSIEYSNPFKTLIRYGTSFDYMYDGSTFVHFREDSVEYHSRLKASKLGLTLMGEMSLYRLSAFANFGVYLYNHDKQLSSIYQRIGLRYRLTNSFYTQLALKTHLNVADYFEFGIGLSLN